MSQPNSGAARAASSKKSRTTGLQLALAQVRDWREQLEPHEYATLVEIAGRLLEAERRRLEWAERRRRLRAVA